MMRLLDSLLISLSLVFFIIGVHQVMTVGITYAYWLFMLSLICLFWHNMRRRKTQEKKNASDTQYKKKHKNRKTSR